MSACPLLAVPPSSDGPPPHSGHSFRIPAPAGAQTILQDCVTKVGATFHQVVTYQPANRYWAFQWYELAIFLGSALLLSGASIWWVRRHLS